MQKSSLFIGPNTVNLNITFYQGSHPKGELQIDSLVQMINLLIFSRNLSEDRFSFIRRQVGIGFIIQKRLGYTILRFIYAL